MAWLRLTLQDGRTCLINSDQVSAFFVSLADYNTGVRQHDGVTGVREGVDEIAGRIEQAERRELADEIFKAIVCNFPHGYNPAEIWDTAWRMLETRGELGES